MMLTIIVNQVPARMFTIGMISHPAVHNQTVAGFKAGMVELGYVENRDVRFIYNGVVEGDPEIIDGEIKSLLIQDVDLFLVAGNLVTSLVKRATERTDIPVLFAAGTKPVEDGIVVSLGSPGCNVTGVRVADTSAKTLEWLLEIIPSAGKVLLPYNPEDSVSAMIIDGLDERAEQLGIELVHGKVRSVAEAIATIENLSKDIDAVLRVPSPTLDTRNGELGIAAKNFCIPMIGSLPLDEPILMTFATSTYEAGKQTARLAHLIHNGAKASDLPVETSDAVLTINLKTAEKIGVYISNDVLIHAETIIR